MSAREIDPDRSRLRRSVVWGDRSRRGGCRPQDERGMNGAREDANARDMFHARRKKTRVERGLGSDVPRDGGWTGGRELAPRALRQARADRVRNLGRAEGAPFATLGRLSRIEGWRANFR